MSEDTPVRQPAIRILMMPRDTNALGTIFGGVILSYIDQAGAVEAHRHGPGRLVTVALHEVVFHEPVFVGDLVSFYAHTVKRGTTSVTVKVEVEAVRPGRQITKVKVTEAEVVFVSPEVDRMTRTLTARSMAQPEGVWVQQFAAPLLMSPDERSIVRLGSVADDQMVLAVLDFEEGSCAKLPIDRATMRYDEWSDIDPAWVLHHFEWVRDAAGRDRLQVRAGFQPLPFRGRLQVEDDGYREYRLPTGRRALYDALVEFVLREWQAKPDSVGPDAESRELTIGEKVVNVSYYSEQPSVWMARGENSQLVAEIARRFDQELATGKYDRLFAPPDSTEE